jgi:hypothetical protein
MTKQRNIKKDLEPSAGDYAHAGVRAVLSLAPVLGGPLVEFFSMVVAPPLEKRRDAWLIYIVNRLNKLECEVEGYKIENLAQNEEFISTLLYATQVAMRTHHEEKLEALRNIVVNSSLGITAPENIHLIFMNMIDRYTPLHLLILRFIENPDRFIATYRGMRTSDLPFAWDLRDAFRSTFSELQIIDEYYEQIIRDLTSDGLVRSDKMPEREKMLKPKLTILGGEFLTLIRAPEYNGSHHETPSDNSYRIS